MRTRWKAGIFAASSLGLVTAASLAQRPEKPPSIPLAVQTQAPTDRKTWRSKAEPRESLPPNPATEASTIEPRPAADDPMDAVESFLRRNRKEADDSIQALSLEAEALRARLARVEAALARWQAVAGSLNPGPKWAQPAEPSDPGQDLPPVDPPATLPADPKPHEIPPTASPVDPPVSPEPGPGRDLLPGPTPAQPPVAPPTAPME